MKLSIAGLGIKQVQQITFETLNTLKKSDVVFYLSGNEDKNIGELNSMGVHNVKPILNLYRDGEKDEDNYNRIFNFITTESKKYTSPSLLVPGHPRVGVSLVKMLKASEGKIFDQVEVLPGISSFSTMINDLEIDPLERGTMMIDANRLLLLNLPLSKNLNVFIYHVCSIGTTRVHVSDASKDNRLDQLKNYLLKFYDQNHLMYLVSSSVDNSEVQIKKYSLDRLQDCLHELHFGVTLYIPPASIDINTINREYLKTLKATE